MIKNNNLSKKQKEYLIKDIKKLLNEDLALNSYVKSHTLEDIINDESKEFQYLFSDITDNTPKFKYNVDNLGIVIYYNNQPIQLDINYIFKIMKDY